MFPPRGARLEADESRARFLPPEGTPSETVTDSVDPRRDPFGGGRVEGLYEAWAAGSEWRMLLVDIRPSGAVDFRTCLVNAGGQAKPKELSRAG